MPDTMKVQIEKGDAKISIDINYEACPMLMNNVIDLVDAMLNKIKEMEEGKSLSLEVSSTQKKKKGKQS